MKRTIFLLLLLLSVASSHAVVISQWTFEINTPPDLNNAAASPTAAADVGTGTASGLHASTGTDWSTPVGNGSANSFSANEWAVGDYFQFQLSTTSFNDITLSWDQTRSATGPATFDLAYSVNGTTFLIGSNNYIVPVITWSTGSPDGTLTSSFTADLSAIAALENAPTVFFRLIADVAATGTTGTSRVDNFTVNGTQAVVVGVPETGATILLFGLTLTGIVGWRSAAMRRR